MVALGKNPPKPLFVLYVSRQEYAFACRGTYAIFDRGPLKLDFRSLIVGKGRRAIFSRIISFYPSIL